MRREGSLTFMGADNLRTQQRQIVRICIFFVIVIMGQWVVGRLSLATLLQILAFQQFIVSTLLQQQQKAPCGIFEILPTQFDYIDIILWDCSRIQQMITSSCVLNFSCVHS